MVEFAKTFKLETLSKTEFIDVTEKVKQALKESKVSNGLATVFTKHTTSAIIINENESLLLEDLKNTLERIAPQFGDYKHDHIDMRRNAARDEPYNAPSHLKSMFLGTTESIPVSEASMTLGTWQSILFVELDGPRKREFVVQITGK
jgi:secondary thiamine-phosphate synthase enzyme